MWDAWQWLQLLAHLKLMDLPPFTTFVTLDTCTTRSCKEQPLISNAYKTPAQQGMLVPPALDIRCPAARGCISHAMTVEPALLSQASLATGSFPQAEVSIPGTLLALPFLPLFCPCHLLTHRPCLCPVCLCPWGPPTSHPTLHHRSLLLLLSRLPAMQGVQLSPCYNQKLRACAHPQKVSWRNSESDESSDCITEHRYVAHQRCFPCQRVQGCN